MEHFIERDESRDKLLEGSGGLFISITTPHYHNYYYSVIVLGDKGVGKSAFIKKFADNCSHIETDDQSTTASIIFNSETIKFKICESKGTILDNQMKRYNYTDTKNIVVLMCDITHNESIDHLSSWYELAKEKLLNATNARIVVVANKYDLFLHAEHKSLVEKFHTFCKRFNLDSYQTDAITDKQNILCNIFTTPAWSMIEEEKLEKQTKQSSGKKSTDLKVEEQPPVENSGCCPRQCIIL
jgi:small GTP-binding protein